MFEFYKYKIYFENVTDFICYPLNFVHNFPRKYINVREVVIPYRNDVDVMYSVFGISMSLAKLGTLP